MRNLWKPSNPPVYIGGVQAIELRTWAFGYENIEYELHSPKGFIYKGKGSTYHLCLYEARKGKFGYKEEYMRFGEEQLKSHIVRLGLPKTAVEQTPYANTFGKRRTG